MDKFQFQEGGLPLTIEYLQAIEKRFEALEKIAQFLTPEGHALFQDDASGKYRGGLRLSGMEITQDEDNNTIQISSGFVLIDGEIVEVKQSGILTILQDGEKLWLHPVVENTPATYKDGSTKPFEVKKYFTIDKTQSEGAIEFNPWAFTVDNAKEFRLIAKSKIESIDSKFNDVDADIEAANNNISSLSTNINTVSNNLSTLQNTTIYNLVHGLLDLYLRVSTYWHSSTTQLLLRDRTNPIIIITSGSVGCSEFPGNYVWFVINRKSDALVFTKYGSANISLYDKNGNQNSISLPAYHIALVIKSNSTTYYIHDLSY